MLPPGPPETGGELPRRTQPVGSRLGSRGKTFPQVCTYLQASLSFQSNVLNIFGVVKPSDKMAKVMNRLPRKTHIVT